MLFHASPSSLVRRNVWKPFTEHARCYGIMLFDPQRDIRISGCGLQVALYLVRVVVTEVELDVYGGLKQPK